MRNKKPSVVYIDRMNKITYCVTRICCPISSGYTILAFRDDGTIHAVKDEIPIYPSKSTCETMLEYVGKARKHERCVFENE